MTSALRNGLRMLLAGSALAIAPVALTVAVPAISHADEAAKDKEVSCPDGTIVDADNNQCVSLTEGISKQLMALPPPPSLAGAGGFGSLPGGIPSLGTINAPDLVLPGLGLGLVPNINLQPQIGLPPPPSLPAPPAINPLNPLGLPPPPF